MSVSTHWTTLMKAMQTRRLRKALRDLGCEHATTKGSHEKWVAPGGHIAIVKAATKDQAPGTLRNIQAALAEEFGPTWLEDLQ